MTSPLKTIARLADSLTRRSDAVADSNADYQGRRPSGDVRLDFANFDRAMDRRF